ncbi:MAG: hypothetical protein Q9O62_10275 [Ardenticatenia bacterium]|nr:hypothetical protein [Ardenticatenia bacterium]
MSRQVAADPEDLRLYVGAGRQVDEELMAAVRRLADRLGAFERTCTEAGFRIPVAHLPGMLYQHVARSKTVDDWVERVAMAIEWADYKGVEELTLAFLSSMWQNHRPESTAAQVIWQALQEDREERSTLALRTDWLADVDLTWWEAFLLFQLE